MIAELITACGAKQYVQGSGSLYYVIPIAASTRTWRSFNLTEPTPSQSTYRERQFKLEGQRRYAANSDILIFTYREVVE